ncbi:MAG: hypothetical protein MI746_11350 [Pseudomonadales bacterium]|nr:hypothetical protein [Pseudomonadales bacterium]
MNKIVLISLLYSIVAPTALAAEECVVLLHGLARVSNSMSELATKLQRAGYTTANINYPSRRYSIPELADDAVGRGVQQCTDQGATSIHFVAHSLGGILVRQYLHVNELPELGRAVMLGTPNQGAGIVDEIRGWPGFGLLGPSAKALGTDSGGIIHELGPVEFELGVIAGNVSINPLGGVLLGESNDSVVTVESTKVTGMKEHLVLPVIHTIMMRNNDVIDHTIHFLKTGQFIPQ